MPPEPGALVVSSEAASDLAVCKALLAHGSKSFSAASWLLPSRMRDDAAVFYAFCRVADDAVDESGDPARAVARLHVRLDRLFADQPEHNAVDRALARVVQRHEMPKAPFSALLEGFEWDAAERRYRTLSDVLAYSARVASAVGVVMTYLMGVRDRDTLARACDLGAAMQLTNICRDVGEDARRGRIYVPEDWLEEEGLDCQAWLAAPSFEPAVGRAVERLLREASRLYERAQPGIGALPSDCRPAIRAAGLIYADIGRVVAGRNFDSVSGRARVGLPRKLWLLARAWWQTRGDEDGLDAAPLREVEFLLP
ncbi:MAG: phytoene/squalene synthase family protein [Nannocystaceae bacterium]|nr:phytoene/squalene synthase family protein [bacterium]